MPSTKEPPASFQKPAAHNTAALLSIGDELVIGQALDTNTQWLADRLLALGIRPMTHLTVGDDVHQLIEAIETLAYDHDLIITTGGLGPTADDLTRDALAEALEQPLVEDAQGIAWLEAWANSRGKPLPTTNRVQAMRPRSAIMLENPRGTAPGIAAVIPPSDELDRERHALIVCLPGPPRECRPMFNEQAVPLLRPAPGLVIQTRLLRHVGLPESVAAERLGDLMDRDRNPSVGTTASGGIVTARIRYEGPADQAHAQLGSTVAAVRAVLAPYEFATDDEDSTEGLPDVILKLLRERNERLVVVESCTGGMLGQAITSVPGSSDAFLGGWQTYANYAKIQLVGVPSELLDPNSPNHTGAVSHEVAQAMAEGALNTALGQDANHALSITGIAGPGGGTETKPVGTVWIGHATRNSTGIATATRLFRITGDRHDVRARSVTAALGMLLFALRNDDVPNMTWQVETDS